MEYAGSHPGSSSLGRVNSLLAFVRLSPVWGIGDCRLKVNPPRSVRRGEGGPDQVRLAALSGIDVHVAVVAVRRIVFLTVLVMVRGNHVGEDVVTRSLIDAIPAPGVTIEVAPVERLEGDVVVQVIRVTVAVFIGVVLVADFGLAGVDIVPRIVTVGSDAEGTAGLRTLRDEAVVTAVAIAIQIVVPVGLSRRRRVVVIDERVAVVIDGVADLSHQWTDAGAPIVAVDGVTAQSFVGVRAVGVGRSEGSGDTSTVVISVGVAYGLAITVFVHVVAGDFGCGRVDAAVSIVAVVVIGDVAARLIAGQRGVAGVAVGIRVVIVVPGRASAHRGVSVIDQTVAVVVDVVAALGGTGVDGSVVVDTVRGLVVGIAVTVARVGYQVRTRVGRYVEGAQQGAEHAGIPGHDVWFQV